MALELSSRLACLQNLNDAKTTVTNNDCARSVQHSSIFHVAVIALRDMPVGCLKYNLRIRNTFHNSEIRITLSEIHFTF